MKMNKNIKDLIEYRDGGILSKEIVRGANLNITLFCMAKDTEISPHTSTKEGIIYTVEGNGVFNLDGKDIKMADGVIIHMKKGVIHSLKADKDLSFLLVLI